MIALGFKIAGDTRHVTLPKGKSSELFLRRLWRGDFSWIFETLVMSFTPYVGFKGDYFR